MWIINTFPVNKRRRVTYSRTQNVVPVGAERGGGGSKAAEGRSVPLFKVPSPRRRFCSLSRLCPENEKQNKKKAKKKKVM